MGPRRIGLIASVLALAAVSCSDDSGATPSTTPNITGGAFEKPSDLVTDEFTFACTGDGGTVMIYAEAHGVEDETIALDVTLPDGHTVEDSATSRVEIPVDWVDGGEYHVTRTYVTCDAVMGAQYQAQGGICE